MYARRTHAQTVAKKLTQTVRSKLPGLGIIRSRGDYCFGLSPGRGFDCSQRRLTSFPFSANRLARAMLTKTTHTNPRSPVLGGRPGLKGAELELLGLFPLAERRRVVPRGLRPGLLLFSFCIIFVFKFFRSRYIHTRATIKWCLREGCWLLLFGGEGCGSFSCELSEVCVSGNSGTEAARWMLCERVHRQHQFRQ